MGEEFINSEFEGNEEDDPKIDLQNERVKDAQFHDWMME